MDANHIDRGSHLLHFFLVPIRHFELPDIRLFDNDRVLEPIRFLHILLIVRIHKSSNGQKHIPSAHLLFCQSACPGTVEPQIE